MHESSLTSQATVQDIRHFYDQEFKRGVIKDEDRAYRWMAQKLFRPYLERKKILDVGCGGGFFLKELHSVAALAIGIDLSGEALRIASQNNPQGYLVQGSAEVLPYSDESFDCLSCLGSLEHFSNIPVALKEFRRVVREGGQLFLMVPNLFWYKDILSVLMTGDIGYRNQQYEFFATVSKWKQIVLESGLKIENYWKYNGISKSPLKQWLKDRLIPVNVSYHIIFACRR